MRGSTVCKVLLKPGLWNVLSSLSLFSCLLFLFLSSFPLSINSPFISFSLPLSLLLSPFPPSLFPPFISCPLTCAWHYEMRSCRLLSRLPSSLNILLLPLGSVSVLVGSSRCATRAYPKLHASISWLPPPPSYHPFFYALTFCLSCWLPLWSAPVMLTHWSQLDLLSCRLIGSLPSLAQLKADHLP